MEVFNYVIGFTYDVIRSIRMLNYVKRPTSNVLRKKWIVLFLKPNSGFGTVAGIDGTVIGQGKQFIFDIAGQRFKIAAREIPATYAAPEQYIAAY